jgi:hypothetical protein
MNSNSGSLPSVEIIVVVVSGDIEVLKVSY